MIVHILPDGLRKRQGQDALLKVNGDAFVDGPLNIVLDTPPTPGMYFFVTVLLYYFTLLLE